MYTSGALVAACTSLDLVTAGVVEAIQAELLPWVLGEGDPLRDRVARRGEVRSAVGDSETLA